MSLQTAEFDGTGWRIKKVVTNSGDQDGTVVYFYDGWKIIETRDGSGNLYQQFIHGTRYIDELVMTRAKSKGDLYVHQDANWNVIGLTDLGGHLVERYVLTPYGEVTVYQETGYGDRDGDGDVDATDKGTPGSTCTGTVSGACRILDLDFDGDYDNDDASLFDSLPQGLARHPGRIATAVDQPFAHQGLLYEPELGKYQNRARQYDPVKRRFAQRDPFALTPRALAGFQDGCTLYARVRSCPTRILDPSGKWTERPREHPPTPPQNPTCWCTETTGEWFIISRCDDEPYFNCHGYAFGEDGWIQVPPGSSEPFPPPRLTPHPFRTHHLRRHRRVHRALTLSVNLAQTMGVGIQWSSCATVTVVGIRNVERGL